MRKKRIKTDNHTKTGPSRTSGTMAFSIGEKLFDFQTYKYVMGILNMTPDSLYDGNKSINPQILKEKISRFAEDGADIIDIGGESTRPGAESVKVDEEIRRIMPAYELVRQVAPRIPVSIDTTKSSVAKIMLEAGADIINDISGFTFDPKMAETVGRKRAVAVLMHIKGTPKNMQTAPEYRDVIKEIISVLEHSISIAVAAGIEKIFVDPGIGFGKTVQHNYRIIDKLDDFRILKRPVLIGLSRKSLIGKVLDLPVEGRLPFTVALNLMALDKGAAVIRVHDVKEGKQTVRLYEEIVQSRKG